MTVDINHPRIPRLLLPDGTAVGYFDITANVSYMSVPYIRESSVSYFGEPCMMYTPYVGIIGLTRNGNDWMLNDASKLDAIKRCRYYSAEPIRR